MCVHMSNFNPDSWVWSTRIYNCHPTAGVMAAVGTWALLGDQRGPEMTGGGGGPLLRAYSRLTLSSLSVPAQARPSSQTWTPRMPPAPLAPPPPASPMTLGKLPGSLDSLSTPPPPPPPHPRCLYLPLLAMWLILCI